MGRTRKDNKSDDIEIISIGKLYNGDWDKKYWSSSRGKDRYPYPVGYKSVRTQNGSTYTMEILEGLKGPSFKISSSDGKSCSGDTPEIVWESFQKGSSKALHAKRFSCKIDAVEIFGFKNTFVQRLLRELAANVGGPAEQSLLTLKFSAGASESNHQLQGKPSDPDSDSLTSLFKSNTKGKRSRNDRVVSSRRLNGTHPKLLQQEECPKNVSYSTSKQRDQSNSRSSELSTFATADDVPETCYTPGSLGPENCIPIAEGGVKLNRLEVSHHLNIGQSLCEEKNLNSSENNIELNIDNMHKEHESSGGSSYFVVKNNIVPEDRDGATNVQHDSNADLWVADTLDHFGDSSPVSSQNKEVHEHSNEIDAIIDGEKSGVLLTESLPEDVTVKASYSTNSEMCDTDSVGDDIAKSMMEILLPRAVPLLKTFTRKKKKSTKSSNTQRSHESNSMPSISMNKSNTDFPAEIEHPGSLSRDEKAFDPCADRASAVCASGVLDTVVLDSFDNHSPQELLNHADATHPGKLSNSLYPPAQLPNGGTEANGLPCQSASSKHGADHASAVCTSVILDTVVLDSFDNYDSQELLNHADASHSGQLSHGLYPAAQLPINGSAEANGLPCQSGSSKHDTGTADLILMRVADAASPLNEFTANSKRARLDYCSKDNKIPTTDLIQVGSVMNSTDWENSSSNLQIPTTKCRSLIENIKRDVDSRSTIQHTVKLNSKLQGHLRLFACYIHPMQISMVQLIVKENEIFTCVKCEYSEHDGILFVYKASKKGEKMGCPLLVGYVSITLQVAKTTLGRDIAPERSLLQLTPDGRLLVLLNSIQTPHCREGKLHCLCSACTSDGFQKNAVKIVRLNNGYASLVAILKTAQDVSCLLVCEPSFLLAAEEGGNLKLWVMNSDWSGPKEDWYLPTFDCMSPCIVELKTAPNSASLVIGHNGLGEFGIWDINKRSFVSRFTSTGMSVLECIPVSVFRWQTKGEYNKIGELVAEIMDATKRWSSGTSDGHIFSPDDKDVAAWLLISTASNPDHESYQSCEQEEADVGRFWRLALLVNNIVITGSIVDEGAAAASGGHGIMGRCDGQVYMWELSTGKKLGSLQTFKGSRVSCIATDTSNSGSLAIASEGQLLVYLQS